MASTFRLKDFEILRHDQGRTIDVLGVGNAIMDLLVRVSDDELKSLGLTKSAMTLIDEEKLKQLDEFVEKKNVTYSSGGSTANTLSALSKFSKNTSFIGKVAQDTLGQKYISDLKKINVEFNGTISRGNHQTGRSYIFITEDGERTMATYLGVSSQIKKNEFDFSLLKKSKILYLEGYLLDSQEFSTYVLELLSLARNAGTFTVLSASDTFIIERHSKIFMALMEASQLDLVFLNEAELYSLTKTEDFYKAISSLGRLIDNFVVTLGPKGCYYNFREGEAAHSQCFEVQALDSTGAGDAFAGVFLAKMLEGASLSDCAQISNEVAREVLMKIGARL